MFTVSYFPRWLILLVLMFVLYPVTNATAQQHIEDCETFQDSELTLLCYQHNIISELQAYWYRFPSGTMALTISEAGYINDLLVYHRWNYNPTFSSLYSGFYFDWIPLPVPKTSTLSEDNYYQLLIEVLPNGEIIARSDLEKREF